MKKGRDASVIHMGSTVSVSGQLLYKFRLDIIRGVYAPGAQFPTVRTLAYELSVNPNTVQKVLTLLEQDGLVIAQGTKGRFVTEDTQAIARIRLLLQTEYLQSARQSALELGITKQQFMQFLSESEDQTL
jgi:DNA-binding transcriptional regulator YhcF (GntR family)